MGRELKRVALDFDWPINEPWEGYLNPFWNLRQDCDQCNNSGFSPMGKYYYDQWYGYVDFNPVEYGDENLTFLSPIMQEVAARNVKRHPKYFDIGRYTEEEVIDQEAMRLVGICNNHWCYHLNQADVNALIEAERLRDFTRCLHNKVETSLEEMIRTRAYYIWLETNQSSEDCWQQAEKEYSSCWLPYPNGYIPTAKEVNEWSHRGFGHDSLNANICVEARCKREGYEYLCEKCKGRCYLWPSREVEKQYNDWKPTEPPAGEGYQIWETVSEGSPTTPVFATPRGLAKWAAENENYYDITLEKWEKWITEVGWSPSSVITNGVVKTGVEAAVDALEKRNDTFRRNAVKGDIRF